MPSPFIYMTENFLEFLGIPRNSKSTGNSVRKGHSDWQWQNLCWKKGMIIKFTIINIAGRFAVFRDRQ